MIKLLKKCIYKISKKDISILCRHLSSILNSGISISQGLLLLEKESKNIIERESLQSARIHVEKGESLSNGFRLFQGIYPKFFISMVSIGEQGGNLSVVFEALSEYYQREYSLSKKIKAALLYPCIILIATVIICGFLITNIIPAFAETFKNLGEAVPKETLRLVKLGDFLKGNYIIVIVFTALIIFVTKLLFNTKFAKRKIDWALVKIPIIKNIYSKYEEARFIKTMSLLLDSGNTVYSSIELCKLCTDNFIVLLEIQCCVDEITKGESLIRSLKLLSIINPMILSILSIGEQTGTLCDMFSNTSKIIDQEMDLFLEKATALIEPIMIFLLSILVSIILFSIMMPLINIMDNL